jgi:SulP family sulfate permease
VAGHRVSARTLLRWLRSIRPEGRNLRADVIAGLPGAISSVPNGMASAALIGVNPIHGLYASFAGPVAGGFATSSQLMVITTTTAGARAAGSALEGVDPADRPQALLLLTIIAGLVMILAGIARLGRYTRFVSRSVMTGFLTGISVNIVLSQLPSLAGANATATSRSRRPWTSSTPGRSTSHRCSRDSRRSQSSSACLAPRWRG